MKNTLAAEGPFVQRRMVTTAQTSVTIPHTALLETVKTYEPATVVLIQSQDAPVL